MRSLYCGIRSSFISIDCVAFSSSLLFILALLLLEEGEVLGVAGLLHFFAGDEAEGCAIDAVA